MYFIKYINNKNYYFINSSSQAQAPYKHLCLVVHEMKEHTKDFEAISALDLIV